MILRSCLALCVVALLPLASQADLSSYSQDFEGFTTPPQIDDNQLSDDGWFVFGNVFEANGTFVYNYGPFGAPNGTGRFCDVISPGGLAAGNGNNVINTFNDYTNSSHSDFSNRVVESLIFQEQTIGSSDLNTKWDYTFEYAANPASGPGGVSTTNAFIKVLNPGNGFSEEAFLNFDTSGAADSPAFSGGSLSIDIDNAWDGYILQFGFRNTAQNFSPTGVYYDNLNFALSPVPEPSSALILGLGCIGLGLGRRRK